MQNEGPKHRNISLKAIVLHAVGVQASIVGGLVDLGEELDAQASSNAARRFAKARGASILRSAVLKLLGGIPRREPPESQDLRSPIYIYIWVFKQR